MGVMAKKPLTTCTAQTGLKYTIPIKKVPKGTSLNGAGNVVVLETISHLLKVVKSEEYYWIEFNLQKLIA